MGGYDLGEVAHRFVLASHVRPLRGLGKYRTRVFLPIFDLSEVTANQFSGFSEMCTLSKSKYQPDKLL